MSLPVPIHVGTYGIPVAVRAVRNGVPLDISSAEVLEIRYVKPSGVEGAWTAALSTDGTDGLFQYDLQSGDIDEHGTWRYQGYINMASFTGSTLSGQFEVEDTIGD